MLSLFLIFHPLIAEGSVSYTHIFFFFIPKTESFNVPFFFWENWIHGTSILIKWLLILRVIPWKKGSNIRRLCVQIFTFCVHVNYYILYTLIRIKWIFSCNESYEKRFWLERADKKQNVFVDEDTFHWRLWSFSFFFFFISFFCLAFFIW